MFPIVLGLLLFTLTGCQSLLLYEEDSGGVIAGKVAARTLLGVSTLGFSEAGMAHVKERLEDSAYPVTAGFHTIRLRSDQPVRVMVMGQHPFAIAEAQRFLAQIGAIVVERVGLDSMQAEQRLRLLQTADQEADLLKVGKLTGADHIVFVETTTKPAQFKISIIRHYALAVSVRGVDTETGRIIWQGNARYSAPVDESEFGLGSLTTWAIARALCKVERDEIWIEPGPYRKRVGCVKTVDQ
jgi:hypothetical protein